MNHIWLESKEKAKQFERIAWYTCAQSMQYNSFYSSQTASRNQIALFKWIHFRIFVFKFHFGFQFRFVKCVAI